MANILDSIKKFFLPKPTVLGNILGDKKTVPNAFVPPAGRPSAVRTVLGIGNQKAIPTPTIKNVPRVVNSPAPKFNMPKIGTFPAVNLNVPGLTYPKSPSQKVMGVRTTPTPTPTPYPDETPYEKLTSETFNKYQIPKAIAYSIASGENGRRNKFNIGAVDSNPTNAPIQSDLANATTSAKMLSGQANPGFYAAGEKGRQAFKNAWDNRSNAAKMLSLIQEAGFAGDPKTWKQRSAAQGGAGLYYDSWDQFIKDTPAYKKWINRK